MKTDSNALIHGYLDDMLSEDQLRELNDWLGSEPGNARHFASVVLLHDRLGDQWRARAVLKATRSRRDVWNFRRRFLRPSAFERHPGAALMALSALAAFAFVAFHNLQGRNASAAELAVVRLIDVSSRLGNRTYRVAVPDGEGSLPPPAHWVPGGPPAPIDGAMLYVLDNTQYVLVRRYKDGSEFIMGSNGRESWSVPPVGVVQISSDPDRFRRAVPGEKHALPFLNARTSLDYLRKAYSVELLSEGTDGQRLLARRLSPDYLGPGSIEIRFSEPSGVIQQMRLNDMPRARGGPRTVVLELFDQKDLGPKFFDHGSHHKPDRTVDQVDE